MSNGIVGKKRIIPSLSELSDTSKPKTSLISYLWTFSKGLNGDFTYNVNQTTELSVKYTV